MKALVTGATGMLGSHLVEALLRRKADVRVLIREKSDTKYLDSLPIEKRIGDVSMKETLENLCNDRDVVFHTAALMQDWGPKEEFIKHNIIGTENILKAAYEQGAKKFVYVSSRSVMGLDESIMLDESAPYKASNTYGDSKIKAEKLVIDFYKKTHYPIVIIRPTWIVGPRDRYSTKKVIEMIKKGKVIVVGDGTAVQSFVHPRDVSEALINSAERKEAVGNIYIVDSGEQISFNQFYEYFAHAMNKDIQIKKISYSAACMLGYVCESIATIMHSSKAPLITPLRAKYFGKQHSYAIAKAKKDLGYVPSMPVKKAVEETVEWFKQQGFI